MKPHVNGDTLRASGLTELSAANANSVRDEILHAFGKDQLNIEIDLSQASVVDSCGLGVLVALHKITSTRGGVLRLLHPGPAVQQILELTRMHRIFEIIKSHDHA